MFFLFDSDMSCLINLWICLARKKMIVYVAKVINLFAIAVQNIILLSSLIGQVIIVTATAVSSACYNVTRNLLCFLQIVYEDNTLIFTEEVPNAVNNIANIIASHLAYLQNDLLLSCENITAEILAMICSLKWLFKSVLLIINEASVILKNGVIFLGNTLWLIVVFFPVQLLNVLKIILDTLTKVALTLIMDSGKMLIDITIFLTDFPVESLIGLASFVVVMFLYVCFKEVIDIKIAYMYWMLNRRFRYIYYILYNYFNDYETRVISRLATGHEIDASTSASGVADIDETDTLCVICQERQKCVLTLPCRHVCLCTECCLQLYGYQRTCPICRTFICHSVTVYL